MGCHTWFYRPAKETQEEMNAQFVESASRTIGWLENMPIESMARYGYTPEQVAAIIPIHKRQLRMVEKGLCQRAVWEHNVHGLYRIHDGVPYKCNNSDLHDVFRVGGYPDDILTSMHEVTQFCEKRGISLTIDQRFTLTHWFMQGPGLIMFG